MPNQNPAFSQLLMQGPGIARRVPNEKKVRLRRQYFETEGDEFIGQPIAAFDDLITGEIEVVRVANGRFAAGQCQPIERLGVEAVLHQTQSLDQSGIANGIGNAQAGK